MTVGSICKGSSERVGCAIVRESGIIVGASVFSSDSSENKNGAFVETGKMLVVGEGYCASVKSSRLYIEGVFVGAPVLKPKAASLDRVALIKSLSNLKKSAAHAAPLKYGTR